MVTKYTAALFAVAEEAKALEMAQFAGSRTAERVAGRWLAPLLKQLAEVADNEAKR